MKKRSYLKNIVILCFLALQVNAVQAQTAFDSIFKSENQYKDVVIQDVVSVDEIIIENYLKRGERIKLIGIKAPDLPQEKKIIERSGRDRRTGMVIRPKEDPIDATTSIEERAYVFVQNLLIGERVRLEFDREKVAGSDKTLAYIFLNSDNTFVNAEILRQGYANLRIQQPNTKYAKDLREAYREARREKRGLQSE